MFAIPSSDRQVLKNQAKVLYLQELLIRTLQNLMTANHPQDVSLFPRLLMIISSLRELSIEYRRMFSSIKDKAELNDELQREILEILGLL